LLAITTERAKSDFGASNGGHIDDGHMLNGPGDVVVKTGCGHICKFAKCAYNAFLPGFYSHAILHLGPWEQWSRLKLANGKTLGEDPIVAATRAAYLATDDEDPHPRRVLESISEGVEFHSLEHAVHKDYLVVLRPRAEEARVAESIRRALVYLGRPYDFDFDFATDHTLVCTELVWRAYQPGPGKDGLTIPLVRMAGRNTLPANHFAQVFAEQHGTAQAQLDYVAFIDAAEKEQRAFFSTPEAFLQTWRRPQWDIVQK